MILFPEYKNILISIKLEVAVFPSGSTKIVGSSQIDMLYLDSPYNISLTYNSGIGTKGKYGGRLTRLTELIDFRKVLIDLIKWYSKLLLILGKLVSLHVA